MIITALYRLASVTIYYTYEYAKSAFIQTIDLLLHRAICNILLQFNVLRLANNVIIHWCWLLLLLLASYCQRVELLTITFLTHSTIVYHSTN